ncbi:5962_t:CDS:2, partial [Funneliformis geosporum]
MSLLPSAIILNQENIFEQKIISKADFNILIQQYTNSFNARFKEKAFINKEIYNDIIKTLLPENNNMLLYNSKWCSCVKNNFILKIIRNDYIKEFCISHASLEHSDISNTYTNLKTKWANIKQDL